MCLANWGLETWQEFWAFTYSPILAERCDTAVLTGGTYGGDGKYKTEKWKREFRNSLMITGSV